jgi:hypothetical protein
MAKPHPPGWNVVTGAGEREGGGAVVDGDVCANFRNLQKTLLLHVRDTPQPPPPPSTTTTASARHAGQGVALLAVWGEPAKQAWGVTQTLPTHCRTHTRHRECL